MIKVNILYGSSCVGKSTIMNNDNNKYNYKYKYKYNYNKVEMDTSNYRVFNEEEWEEICINFLIENIINNLNTKDMIVTCGALPLPNHTIYTQLEEQYSIKFIHSLILVKDIDKYKTFIKKRNRDDSMEKLLEDYKWRESTSELYDEIIFNK
jgi:guanylate kinase